MFDFIAEEHGQALAFGHCPGSQWTETACLRAWLKNIAWGPYAPDVKEHNRLAQKMLYSMQAQVPPEELEEFEKLSDADAPRRCRECNCELPADARRGQLLCVDYCPDASRLVAGGLSLLYVFDEETRKQVHSLGAGTSEATSGHSNRVLAARWHRRCAKPEATQALQATKMPRIASTARPAPRARQAQRLTRHVGLAMCSRRSSSQRATAARRANS